MSGKFYAKSCSTRTWVFENKDAEIEERPITRSLECMAEIKQAENDLQEAMETQDFATLDRVYKRITDNEMDIDVKLLDKAEKLHLKLEKELDIRTFIASVAHVPNYKTIRKSVTVLNKKLKDAEGLGVDVDPELIAEINQNSHRLINERNLRFEMENMDASNYTKDTVSKLQGLIQLADDYNVEQQYLSNAQNLCGKMNDNIVAHETLQLLLDYPIREYPEPEPLDAKGKPLKAKDDKKKPKKRKKEPAFPTPEWAL